MADIKKFQFILDGKIANNFKSELDKLGGTISGLNDTQVVVDFNENATMANFKKLYQKLEKENSDLTVQFRYDINKAMLQQAQNELSQLEVYVDVDKANNKILELVNGLKDINLKINVDGIDSEDLNRLESKGYEIADKIGKIIRTHISLDGSDKIFNNLDKEVKDIIESFIPLSDIKEIKPFDIKNIDKQRREVESIKSIMTELESKGAISSDKGGNIDAAQIKELRDEISEVKEDISSLKGRVGTLEDITAFDTLSSKASDFGKEVKGINQSVIDLQKVLTPLYDGINKVYKEKDGKQISGYWDTLKKQIDESDSELKELLKTIGLYDSESNSLNLIATGNQNSGGLIGDDKVLISRKKDLTSFEETLKLKERLDEAYKAGVNVSRILDIIGTKESDVFLEIQERNHSSILGNINNADKADDWINPELFEATDKQLKKLIEDAIKLDQLGFGLDIHESNVLFDKEKGFSIIDLDLNPAKYENYAEFVDEIIGGLVGAYEIYYEETEKLSAKEKMEGTNLVEQFRERFVQLANTMQQAYANAQDSNSPSKEFEKLENDAIDGIVEGANKNEDRLKNVGKQMADNVKEGFKEGMAEVGATALSEGDKSSVLSGNQTEVLSGDVAPAIEAQNKLESTVEETTSALEEQEKAVKRILYHWGNFNSGKVGESFNQMITSYFAGVNDPKAKSPYGAFGTGVYSISNPERFTSIDTSTEDPLRKFMAIDVSNLKMYETKSEEHATALFNFLTKLQQICINLATGFDYDGKFDASSITVNEMYEEAKSLFANMDMTYEQYIEFINHMQELVKKSGLGTGKAVRPNGEGKDNIATKFMKALGYQGIDNTGTSYDSFTHGSVIFDKPDLSMVTKWDTASEAIEHYNQNVTTAIRLTSEVNKTPLSLHEESSGQFALFEGVEEQQKEIETSVEKTNDAIKGQITLVDYLNEQKNKSVNSIKDTFDVDTESSEMDKVATATDEAVQAKKDFATANEGVQDSVDGSKSKLELEAELMDKLAKSAREAADAKKEFVKANKEVKDSEGTSEGKTSKVDDIINKINSYNKVDSFFGFVKNDNLDSKRYQNVANEIENIINKQGKYKVSVKSTEEEIQKLDDATQTFADDFESKFQKQQLALADTLENKIKRITSGKTFDKENTEILNNIDSNIDKLRNINIFDVNDLTTASKVAELISTINQDINKIKNVSNNPIALLPEPEDINKSIGQINKVLSGGYKLPQKLKTEFKELRVAYKNAFDSNGNVKITNAELQKLDNTLSKLNAEFEATGKRKTVFGSLTTRITDMNAKFLAQYFSFQDILRYAQQAYQYVAEIDKQMIELEKVSDMSTDRLAQSFEHAKDSAKDLGSTVADVIAATADWSRLGYDADAAEQLAEVATIYKNVGDGIDINEANESLISTLQGFEMEASQAMEIVDSFNEVANRMPIDSAGIGEALQRSAAAFNAANTDLNSAIALITATNSVLQNPEKVGRMWTTVSARIRGASQELIDAGEETDGMVESTSKLRELVKGVTGFDIMADENTFKDMKEIIVGIGKEWDKLSDIDQAGLLEALAGKQQSNALAAALSNYEMIEEAYSIAEGSAGSAMKEQEKWEQGLEARTNKLKASLESLSTTFLDSDFLGGLIDVGRGLIDILTEIIDKLGVIPTLLIGGGGIFATMKAFKGEGKYGFKIVHIS